MSLTFFFIGITIVAGIIVGSVYYLQHYVLPPYQPPPAPQTAQQQAVDQYGPNGGTWQTQTEIGFHNFQIGYEIGLHSMGIQPETNSPSATNSLDETNIILSANNSTSATNAPGFNLQYGIMLNTTDGLNWAYSPWTATSSNVPPMLQQVIQSLVPTNSGGYLSPGDNPQPECLILNNTNTGQYALSASVDGVTLVFSSQNINGYDTAGNYTNTTDYSNLLAAATVVIERSTNLVYGQWTPIFTNYIGYNTVESFLDTNIFQSTEVTFYNTDTNIVSGGGPIPPGDGGGYSTNGVYYIPGQAYYRLAINPAWNIANKAGVQ